MSKTLKGSLLFPRGILSVAALLTWLHPAPLTVSSGGWLTPFQGCQKSQAWWWLPYTSRSFWVASSNPGTFPIFSFLLRDSCVKGTHRTCDIYYESFPFFIVHHCNVRLVCLHCQIQLLLLCSHPVFLLSMEHYRGRSYFMDSTFLIIIIIIIIIIIVIKFIFLCIVLCFL